MATIKKHFYVAKGETSCSSYLYYGEEPPVFRLGCPWSTPKCKFIGSFDENSIADSIKSNSIVKISIRITKVIK